MFKRGVSPVIITVLIIVISLASVTIIFGAMNPVIEDTKEEIQTKDACLSLVVVPRACTVNGSAASVTLERRAGEGTFEGILFAFDTPPGQEVVRLNETLNVLDSRSFSFDQEEIGKALRVDIAPYILGEKTCALTGSPIECVPTVGRLDISACSDGEDNDGDGAIDYPADFSCESAADTDETNPLTQCQDGIDNEGDGWRDAEDPGCLLPDGVYNSQYNNESFVGTTECSDQLDNQDPEDALIDGNDPDCVDWRDVNETYVEENQLGACENGDDDDGDSWADALDPDCMMGGDHEVWWALTECQDGIDNDGDGQVDRADGQCESAHDRNERDKTGEAQCMNGRDDDEDGLIDYGVDPGCGNTGDNSEGDESTSHNFVFSLSQHSTKLYNLQWNDPQGTLRQVILWDNVDDRDRGYLLHSSKTHVGLQYNAEYVFHYSSDGKRFTPVEHDHLLYSYQSERPDGFVLRVEPSDNSIPFYVQDIFTFRDDKIYWSMTVTNEDSEKLFVRVPFFLSGLQMGTVDALIPSTGNVIRDPLPGDTYGTINYPTSIATVAPVIALSNNDFTLGGQVLSILDGTTHTGFRPLSGGGIPALWFYIMVPLEPGESRTFTAIFKLAANHQWTESLMPYKQWFDYMYGTEPTYCPDRAFAYTVGRNTNSYDLATERYKPGTLLAQIPSGDVAHMADRGIAHLGLWASAIHTKHITTGSECQGSACEFNPAINLLDPNIDAGPLPSKISDYTSGVGSSSNGRTGAFFFARPCSDIEGADILYDSQGSPTITRGAYVGYASVDLRNVTNRERYVQRMQFLTDRGAEGFYFDAMGCPGDEAFINHVNERLNLKFIAMEGFRDRTSLWWPQIPFPKEGSGGGVYNPEYNLLIEHFVPYATYYGGDINNVLTGGETADFLSKGGQAVVASWKFGAQTFPPEVCSWMTASYENQLALWSDYGSGISNCGRPQPPAACS